MDVSLFYLNGLENKLLARGANAAKSGKNPPRCCRTRSCFLRFIEPFFFGQGSQLSGVSLEIVVVAGF